MQEMSRVLKPGGRIVIATWCEREATLLSLRRRGQSRLGQRLGRVRAHVRLGDAALQRQGARDPRLLVRRMVTPVLHLD